jgi:hypothetical protein
MEASGQHHASAALPRRKNTWYSLNRRPSGRRSGRFREEILLATAGLWTPDRPACSLVTKPTELTWFLAAFRCSTVLNSCTKTGSLVGRKYVTITVTEPQVLTRKPTSGHTPAPFPFASHPYCIYRLRKIRIKRRKLNHCYSQKTF